MTNLRKSLALGAAVALAACGGGSSSTGRTISYSGKTTVATVTTDNALTLAGSATGVAGATSGVGTIAAVKASPRSVLGQVLAAAATAQRAMPVTFTGVTASQTQPCDGGGSMTVSASIAHPGTQTTPTVYTTGDWIQISYAACKDSLGTLANGSMRLTITQAPAGVETFPSPSDPSGMPIGSYGMKITVASFSTDDTATGDWSGVNGDMAFSWSWNGTTMSATISGTAIEMEAGNGTTTTASSRIAGLGGTGSYSLTEAQTYTCDTTTATCTLVDESVGASVRMCSIDMAPPDGGCLDLLVSPALKTVVPDLYPSSGELKVTGQGGAYVDVLVKSNAAVDVTYDVDGTGPTAAVTLVDVPWTCLESHVGCP